MKGLVRFDPFRLMRRWDPFEDLRVMQKELDHWFGRLLGEGEAIEPAGLWVPAVESYIRDGHLVIKAELPGVDAKDLDVTLTERELVIKGERKAEKEMCSQKHESQKHERPKTQNSMEIAGD